MTMRTGQRQPFTGRHMATILVTFFAIVIAVNIYMAWCASSSFGGLVVDNSYVASQKFNGWLAEARREKAMGWTVGVTRDAGGRLDVAASAPEGPLTGAVVTAVARHPLGRLPDRAIRFDGAGAGRYRSIGALPAGRWIVHLDIRAQGARQQRLVDLQ